MDFFAQRYGDILAQVVLAGDASAIECHLSDAFELGRRMVERGVPPDELIHIHHGAVVSLAASHPSLIDAGAAQRLSGPLMEMSMSYGMAFRQQMERRYQAMVENRLEHSQKMEAVGTLAAGIAHDFNNMLGAIMGFAELVGDEQPPGSVAGHNVRQILTACERARDLVASMLTFARQGRRTTLAPVDLVAHVRETLDLMRASYGPATRLVFEPRVAGALVMADPAQPQQIVLNLCANAADAIDHLGEIVVRMEAATIEVAGHAKGEPAVCLTVTDHGHGMPPEVIERIFDPFFTTKAPGKGSGLGLSVVHGIVAQLHGELRVRSQTSGNHRGTTFSVLLPLMRQDAADHQPTHGEP
nr:ATP-binding protein [uncultured Duganella sp.]